MSRYSFANLVRHGLTGHRNWQLAWRDPEPKSEYDAVIGGGGHGLASAYYLAKNHGLNNVAVLEKAWPMARISISMWRAVRVGSSTLGCRMRPRLPDYSSGRAK